MNILALHGGGFLGFFSACMLQSLDQRRRRLRSEGLLADSFDLIAGSSAGAILAAGLAVGATPERMVALMADAGPRIFPRRRFLRDMPGLFRARFRPGPLRAALAPVLGCRRMGDLDRALLITAINLTAGRVELIASYRAEFADMPLIDAVLASTAAPTLFPRHEWNGAVYTDGGLAANGPALCAAIEAQGIFGRDIAGQGVVSIGTTHPETPAGAAHGPLSLGVFGWLLPRPELISVTLDSQVELQGRLLERLGPRPYLHFDRPLPAGSAAGLMRADPPAQAALRALADAEMAALTGARAEAMDRILLRPRQWRLTDAPVAGLTGAPDYRGLQAV